MDPLFLAYSYFRRRKYEPCVDLCTQLLEKNPYDQVSLPTPPPHLPPGSTGSTHLCQPDHIICNNKFISLCHDEKILF